MVKRILLIGCIACLALSATTALAESRGRVLATPHRFLPNTDDGLVQITAPLNGRTWSVWSYRNGAERDIALSVLDARGLWTEPQFIGRDDGIDQVQPALTVDATGRVFLAYAERQTGRNLFTTRSSVNGAWSAPDVLNDPGQIGSAPAIRIVGDTVVIAFLAPGGITFRERDLANPMQARSIQDGPDPVGGKPPEDDPENGSHQQQPDGGRIGSDDGPLEFGPGNAPHSQDRP